MVPSILIVEDDLTFSTMLKTWLGKKGFEVETASTQAKARKQIGTRKHASKLARATSTLSCLICVFPTRTD